MKCLKCQAKTEPGFLSFDLDTPKSSTLTLSKLPGYICTQCGEEYLTESAIRQIESVENSLEFHEQEHYNFQYYKHMITQFTDIDLMETKEHTETQHKEILSKIVTALDEKNKLSYWEIIMITIYLNNQIYDKPITNKIIQQVIRPHFPNIADHSSLMLRKMIKEQKLYFDDNKYRLTTRGKQIAETILFIYIENYETLQFLEIEEN